jgi:hypothetical protein
MRRYTSLLFSMVAGALLAGCASHALVQITPNGYLVRKEAYDGPLAPDNGGLKQEAVAEADAFARERGKVAVPVAGDRHSTGMWRHYVSYEYQFRLADPNLPR